MAQDKFEQLQKLLRKKPYLVSQKTNCQRTLVYITGLSLDQAELKKVAGIECYEERLLYAIGLLRNKNTKVIFVTSKQINPVIIDYYFDLFSRSNTERKSMEKRWFHYYIGNTKPDKSLTQKVLNSKRLLTQINNTIDSKDQAVLRCFNVTDAEKELAIKLGIPLFAPDPRLNYYGSKSGARKIFKKVGLKPPAGTEDIKTIDKLINSIHRIKKHDPKAKQVVLKFNYSFSGGGNANLNIQKIPTTIKAGEKYILKNLQPCEINEKNKDYLEKFLKHGGIVEKWIEASKIASPSVQLTIRPDKEVIVLSTHEQIVDEETKQVYLGARFPARRPWRLRLAQQAKKIGEELANKGVIGHFSVDFIAAKINENYSVYPIEINLRKGGTTHPLRIARILTHGHYEERGVMKDNLKRRVYYHSFDNIKSPDYVGVKPEKIIQIVKDTGLAFDKEANVGVTLHILGALQQWGKFGAVCIAKSATAAETLYYLLKKNIDTKLADERQVLVKKNGKPTVSRNKLVNTFLTLVKISSPSGDEEAVRLWIREELVKYGVKVRKDKAGNLICKKAGTSKTPILLSAHMDTVEPGRNIKPVIRRNNIMSDGNTILGADDKAGIAYILELMRILYEYKIDHKPIEIVLSVGEETFSTGANQLNMSALKSPVALVIDGAEIGEIDYAAPYIATIDANIKGRAAHSGVEPEKGIDAVKIASTAIHNMRLGRIDKDTTANIGMVKGGSSRNTVPYLVKLKGEVRSFSKRKMEEQIERMHKALEDAAEKHRGLLDINSAIKVIGYTHKKNDPDIKALSKVFKKVGIVPNLRKTGGGSDANVFMAKGIKAIDVGMGGKNYHTVIESINIKDMMKMVEFLLQYVKV